MLGARWQFKVILNYALLTSLSLMRCIFCKSDSSTSKTVEHIIPESLGNVEQILPTGVVCDKCNNYFSRKVEAPLLNSEYFLQARSRNMVPSKKGRLPSVKGVHLQSRTEVEIVRDEDGLSIYPSKENFVKPFIESVLASRHGDIMVPIVNEPPSEYIVSRFLGKVAIEALAQRFIGLSEWEAEIIDKKELDNLRNYVRFGRPQIVWQFHKRVIYSEDAIFYSDDNVDGYEVLHEYTFYIQSQKDYFFWWQSSVWNIQ